MLKKKEIKKEDLDIKKSLKNDVFFRENNLLHHFYNSYYLVGISLFQRVACFVFPSFGSMNIFGSKVAI